MRQLTRFVILSITLLVDRGMTLRNVIEIESLILYKIFLNMFVVFVEKSLFVCPSQRVTVQ